LLQEFFDVIQTLNLETRRCFAMPDNI